MSLAQRFTDAWSVLAGQKHAGDVPARPAPDSDFWWQPLDGVYPDGLVAVTPASVLQLPVVRACIGLIAEIAATLPLVVYERGPNGQKQRVDSHPLYDVLNDRPNALQSGYEWRAQMMWDLCAHRNAYSEILPGRRGAIDQLGRIDPQLVEIVKTGGGREFVYEVMDPDTRDRRRVVPEEMFHVRAAPLTPDNLMGQSIIRGAWRTFALALALEDYGIKFFQNDSTPVGVIKGQGGFQNAEKAKEYRAYWEEQLRGANRHRVAVLPPGTEFEAITIPNDKAQFLESKDHVNRQILRLWRVQPHKAGILDDATFSNIEQQGLEFVNDTLRPWLTAFEKAVNRTLVLNTGRFFVEHDTWPLIRGDLKTRFEAYNLGRQGGWLSVNEIRDMENMNRIDGGDEYLEPLNMQRVGEGATQAIADRVVPQIAGLLEDHRREAGADTQEGTDI